MKPVQKIRCYERSDRQSMAAILVANGYTVWQGKEAKSKNRKTVAYYIYFREPEEDQDDSDQMGGEDVG